MDSIDLEYWMTNLPSQLREIPLIHLAIPGSHDSMTSSITTSSKLAPDAEVILKRLYWLGPILRILMYRWCRTQVLNIVEQLNRGIRYFDLRVATKLGASNLYFVHGLYANEINSSIIDIRNFIDAHPEEIIILDFQHFYGFNDTNHKSLITLIKTIFKYKLLPFRKNMEGLSLNYITRTNKYQVIVIYRSAFMKNDPMLWNSWNFPTPWPNTTSATKLIEKLDEGLAHRAPGTAYISQFLLTPTTWFVFKHMFSSLKTKCVVPILARKYKWINEQKIGEKGINIIIGDFIDLNNSAFALEVIRLNLKCTLQYTSSSLTPVD